MSERVSVDGRVRFRIELLSSLKDIEAGLGEESLLVDGLDEALQLPCIGGGLSGSQG